MESDRPAAPDLIAGMLAEPPDLSCLSDSKAWQSIKQHADADGVTPVLAYIARSHVEPAERAWCDRVLNTAWNGYETRVRQLDRVLGVLSDSAVEAICLKGPVLAARHYSPPFLRRPSLDLDLAVRKRDLERACSALAGIGYAVQGSMREILACSHHVEMRRPGKPTVELHFRSHGRLGIPADEFFARARSFRIATGRTVLVPGRVDELLYLMLHLSNDRFKSIFHLYEFRKVWTAAAEEERQETLARAAEKHFLGVAAMVDVAFRFHWGTPFIPAGSRLDKTWLTSRIDAELYAKFQRVARREQELTLASRLRGRWLDMHLTDRPTDLLKHVGLLARISWFQIQQRGWRKISRKALPGFPGVD